MGVGAPALGDGSSPAEIVAARELFRQGTEDADAGRFAEGLEKFRKVASIKETAAVRFNIARCEESLQKTGAARADFELAEREAGEDPKGDEVARLAHDRADALRPRVPRLSLTPPTPLPSGLVVSVDGGKLAVATLGVPLPLDPGPHVIEASAPGHAPFRAEVKLVAGESKRLPLELAASPGGSSSTIPPDPSVTPPPPEAPVAQSSSRRTWGFVTLGGAVAFGGAAVGFLLAHNGQVDNITNLCPKNHCPPGSQDTVNSYSSQANTDQIVATVFAGAAGVAAAAGLYLVLSAPSSHDPAASTPRTDVVLGAPSSNAGLSVVGSF